MIAGFHQWAHWLSQTWLSSPPHLLYCPLPLRLSATKAVLTTQSSIVGCNNVNDWNSTSCWWGNEDILFVVQIYTMYICKPTNKSYVGDVWLVKQRLNNSYYI